MRSTAQAWIRGFFLLATAAIFSGTAFGEVRDGKLFDQGAMRDKPAENASEALAQVSSWVGDWDLELVIHRPGQDNLSATGIAKVTYMNRGHGLMERTRVPNFDGQGLAVASLGMVAVDGNGTWTVSEGNSWAEAISVYSGGFEGEDLKLHDARRPGGGSRLMVMRRTYSGSGDEQRTMKLEASNDLGATWATVQERTYRRRAASADFFPVRDDVGLPAADRPAEAAEFDFLLGEFQATHSLAQPQRTLRWRSNSSAVYALDGQAILEFDWHEMDPSLPNAATTVLRLYNRSMRRWESLFLTNRGNVPLHFGGVREDQRIVLHPFASQTAASQLSQWIFFDQRADAYRWKGMVSNDRGKTYQVGWAIDFARQGAESSAVSSREEIHTTTADGLAIYGDHYRAASPAATTVVLFHQAGGDARGEYGSIAQRLVEDGFEVFAWDARGGGDRFGGPNRTVAGSAPEVKQTYCAAYPDLQAALQYAYLEGSGGPIFAVGSSYSAALAIRLAAEHGDLLTGAVAFSPASGKMEGCGVDTWLPKVDGTPLLVARPESEVEIAGVITQGELFAKHGIEVLVANGAPHGASMLDPERTEGDVEPTWQRLLAFFADPSADPTAAPSP